MGIKRSLLVFILTFNGGLMVFLQAQEIPKDEPIDTKQHEIFIGGNYNFSGSTGTPLNIWKFYDYNNPEIYTDFIDEVQELSDLENETKWTFEPQFELGYRYLKLKNNLKGAGINIVLTGNHSSATIRGVQDDKYAEFHFSGSEMRMMIQPSYVFRVERIYFQANLVFGLGFSKNYQSYIRLIEANSADRIVFPDHDYYYKVDYSLGLGFGMRFEILEKINLGLNYNLYRINYSPYELEGWLPLKYVNYAVNNSISVSLGYRID